MDTDPLIQAVLEEQTPSKTQAGLLLLSVEELAPETRAWLHGSDIGQIGAIALQTAPEHQPAGVVLVADHQQRRWSDLQLEAFFTLVQQLAWSYRSTHLTALLKQQCQSLECFNWYRQRRLEEIYRTVAKDTQRLHKLIAQRTPAAFAGAGMSSGQGVGSNNHQPALGQLQQGLDKILSLIQSKDCQFHSQPESIGLATLLKRVLEDINPWIHQRQLWPQVHNRVNITLSGDIEKIQLVLYELLDAACRRSPVEGRIDIWCQPLDQHWLELSITDNGVLEPELLFDLQQGDRLDLLATSTLNQPPGKSLKVIQAIAKQLGGQIEFNQLEDGRGLSRLTLPLVATPQTEP